MKTFRKMVRNAKTMRKFAVIAVFAIRRGYKRRMAMKLRAFMAGIHKLKGSKVLGIIKQYRWCIIKCQRWVRQFLACKRARIEALQRRWNRIAAEHAGELKQMLHVERARNTHLYNVEDLKPSLLDSRQGRDLLQQMNDVNVNSGSPAAIAGKRVSGGDGDPAARRMVATRANVAVLVQELLQRDHAHIDRLLREQAKVGLGEHNTTNSGKDGSRRNPPVTGGVDNVAGGEQQRDNHASAGSATSSLPAQSAQPATSPRAPRTITELCDADVKMSLIVNMMSNRRRRYIDENSQLRAASKFQIGEARLLLTNSNQFEEMSSRKNPRWPPFFLYSKITATEALALVVEGFKITADRKAEVIHTTDARELERRKKQYNRKLWHLQWEHREMERETKERHGRGRHGRHGGGGDEKNKMMKKMNTMKGAAGKGRNDGRRGVQRSMTLDPRKELGGSNHFSPLSLLTISDVGPATAARNALQRQQQPYFGGSASTLSTVATMGVPSSVSFAGTGGSGGSGGRVGTSRSMPTLLPSVTGADGGRRLLSASKKDRKESTAERLRGRHRLQQSAKRQHVFAAVSTRRTWSALPGGEDSEGAGGGAEERTGRGSCRHCTHTPPAVDVSVMHTRKQGVAAFPKTEQL